MEAIYQLAGVSVRLRSLIVRLKFRGDFLHYSKKRTQDAIDHCFDMLTLLGLDYYYNEPLWNVPVCTYPIQIELV